MLWVVLVILAGVGIAMAYWNTEQPVNSSLDNANQPAEAVTCVVGGCNGELCGKEGDLLASNCFYRAEHACYKSATCEVQASGSCGWTQTKELQECITRTKEK